MRDVRTALAALLLCGAVLAPPPPAAAQEEPAAEWSVELELETAETPQEKIESLNRQIMDLKARGIQGAQLGDLFNDLGVLHARQQDWPPARDAFLHAVQAKPADPDFHRNLGLVLMRIDEYEMAATEFMVYRDLSGGLAQDAYRLLAQAQVRLGDLAQAREVYRQGLQTLGRTPGPEVCRLILDYARLEHEHGDDASLRQVLETWHPAARAWLDKAAETGESDGVQEARSIENNLLSGYLKDGQLLEESGLHGEALELYEKAYAIAPHRDDLLPRLVAAQLAGGDAFQARVTARLARQDHPDQVGTWVASARVYEAEDQPREALAAYERAFALAPDTPGLRLKLGNLHLKLGQAAEGRRYLVEAIEAPDTPTEVVYNYGVSLLREKMFAAAVPPLQRVVRENPGFAGGWLALAQAFRGREQYGRAVEAYQEAVALQPDARTAYNLGVTAAQARQWDAALQAYDLALALEPGHREAAYNRAVALMRAGRLAAADSAFASYRQDDPQHYRASLNHGVTLYRLGRHEDAIEVYSLMLEIQETAEVWDNMGLAYQELGDKKKAEQCFKEAAKLRKGA